MSARVVSWCGAAALEPCSRCAHPFCPCPRCVPRRGALALEITRAAPSPSALARAVSRGWRARARARLALRPAVYCRPSCALAPVCRLSYITAPPLPSCLPPATGDLLKLVSDDTPPSVSFTTSSSFSQASVVPDDQLPPVPSHASPCKAAGAPLTVLAGLLPPTPSRQSVRGCWLTRQSALGCCRTLTHLTFVVVSLRASTTQCFPHSIAHCNTSASSHLHCTARR